MRGHRAIGFIALSALLGITPEPPPRTPEEANRRERQRTINNIVYRVCTEREADAVEVQNPDGPEVVKLVAADMAAPTPAECDDFEERLEAAFERATLAKLRLAAEAAKGPQPHITEGELDKFSAATGVPRDQAQAEVEKMVGRPVVIGEVKPVTSPRAGQRRQPVRRARSERVAARKRARRR